MTSLACPALLGRNLFTSGPSQLKIKEQPLLA